MIRHIVTATFKPETTPLEIEQIVAALRDLPAAIGVIESYEVGIDTWHMQPERSADLGIISAFADLEALNEYQDHPVHQAAARRLRAASQTLTVVDYEFET
jgi:hypothetical protein